MPHPHPSCTTSALKRHSEEDFKDEELTKRLQRRNRKRARRQALQTALKLPEATPTVSQETSVSVSYFESAKALRKKVHYAGPAVDSIVKPVQRMNIVSGMESAARTALKKQRRKGRKKRRHTLLKEQLATESERQATQAPGPEQTDGAPQAEEELHIDVSEITVEQICEHDAIHGAPIFQHPEAPRLQSPASVAASLPSPPDSLHSDDIPSTDLTLPLRRTIPAVARRPRFVRPACLPRPEDISQLMMPSAENTAQCRAAFNSVTPAMQEYLATEGFRDAEKLPGLIIPRFIPASPVLIPRDPFLDTMADFRRFAAKVNGGDDDDDDEKSSLASSDHEESPAEEDSHSTAPETSVPVLHFSSKVGLPRDEALTRDINEVAGECLGEYYRFSFAHSAETLHKHTVGVAT